MHNHHRAQTPRETHRAKTNQGRQNTRGTPRTNKRKKTRRKQLIYGTRWHRMDEEDRADTIDILKQSDEWVIWKTKDKWSTLLKASGFYQLLYIKSEIQEECWGSKIKG
jgi:hypothetical protein